ncbi:acyl-CoA dehydrogenase family protein [Actinoplanes teichomyceticus]|uniref:Alkylation response protein AidB-like acyl-CoA dehydrogenase n=1 Tax=Actinoplanes teichomyceticus TaxID=1867 RepID=A0A561WLN7_ACTTI|nr:acyl-CoA dehydrogenase family protein [Actinoplanes teichomyceticus]TWG24784.1 alkylation response protein AidB-like acyl-CoA dehydrogenase [Actinoplanes teichomyceticus]GIF14554.1 oxidoreductase [Actinoplanes teichomyceticus]
MRSLDIAREACEASHPGLLKALSEHSLSELERPGGPAVKLFRDHGGAGLLVPRDFGGAGAGALTAVRINRALGAASPSLGAAVTMHHFTAGMLYSLTGSAGRLTGAQLGLLERVAGERLLMASAWAEGRSSQNILVPAVKAEPAPGGGFVVNGVKKPCSLARSMDLLTASVAVPGDDGESLAVLLIPADTPGISVHPFWSNPVLAAAESEEVRLEDVHVPEDLVIRTVPDDPTRLDDLQSAGFVWFVMLISSVYTGAASALTERVLKAGRGSVTDRAALGVQLDSAVGLLEGVARAVDAGELNEDVVAAALVARYAVQDHLVRVADLAVETLGGIAWIKDPEIAYLASAVRPLAFHPPSRASAAEPLIDYFSGEPLRLS